MKYTSPEEINLEFKRITTTIIKRLLENKKCYQCDGETIDREEPGEPGGLLDIRNRGTRGTRGLLDIRNGVLGESGDYSI